MILFPISLFNDALRYPRNAEQQGLRRSRVEASKTWLT
jgi:hypothetical protein